MPNIEYVSHDNLEYFKDKVLTKVSNTYMPLTGGTFTGNVSFSSSGIASGTIINLAGFTTIGATNTLIYQSKTSFLSGYATENYVDTKADNYVLKAGDTISGVISRSSGGSYTQAPSKVLIRQTKTNALDSSYNPIIGVDTQSGFWSLGSRGGDNLSLNYSTSSDISSDTGTHKTINFPSAGSEGTLALTSDITSALVGYATQTWVENKGYITSSAVKDGTLTLSKTQGAQSPYSTFSANQSSNTSFNVDDLTARYHLGAYETLSGNVITRKTWYVSSYKTTSAYGSVQAYVIGDTNLKALYTDSSITYPIIINLLGADRQRSASTQAGNFENNTYALTQYGLVIILDGTTDTVGKQIEVQYQLPVAQQYTDNPIENQSMLPLDSNMTNKIRQKVVDGLNLFDFDSIGNNVYTSTTPHNVSTSIDKNAKTVSATATGTYSRCIIKLADYLVANKTYTFAFTLTGSAIIVGLSNTGTHIDNTEYGNIRDKSSGIYSITFTATTNVLYLVLYVTTSLSSGSVTLSNIILVEGNHPYPYSDFNQKEHITNAQAELLKQEWEKRLNLFKPTIGWSDGYSISTSAGNTWSKSGSRVTSLISLSSLGLKAGENYVVSNVAIVAFYNGPIDYQNFISCYVHPSYYSTGNCYFTIPSNATYIRFDTTTNISSNNIMLVKGNTAYPYQEYCGKILHEIDINDGSNVLPTKIKQKEYTIVGTYNNEVIASETKAIISIEKNNSGNWEKNNFSLSNCDIYVNTDGYLVLYNRTNDLVGVKIRLTYIAR